MACTMDVPYRTYQSYEQGRSAPKLAGVERLATQTGVSLDWLVCGRGGVFGGPGQGSVERGTIRHTASPQVDIHMLAAAEELIDNWLRDNRRKMTAAARATAVADTYALIVSMVSEGVDRQAAYKVARDNVIRLKSTA